ncbi:hypothetical protein KUTeg_008487 [Tegillarca granosa]|uniref:Uncharacterized protein n=1 Tax=Tegillarca granosa TaxID=220873 RepID=A0ABQ9F9A3_TEGGR|nr:hypothetical protein KUTeg_008487 [Tegillarca granosa]
MIPHYDRHSQGQAILLNSIPHGTATPKFPVPVTRRLLRTSSLTQLLQELANEHPSLDAMHFQRSDNNFNPFQVKRRGHFSLPPRPCKSLDYIPSDRDEYASSNASSACGSPKLKHIYTDPFYSGRIEQYLAGRNALGLESLSISSIASSSEMSKSDPAINIDSGSAAYESEYDNYRPGMTSDEDYFIPDPVSDIDVDAFDDVNIDNVTVSDSFSLDMPLPVRTKKITDV